MVKEQGTHRTRHASLRTVRDYESMDKPSTSTIASKLQEVYVQCHGNLTEIARTVGLSRQALTRLRGQSRPVEEALQRGAAELADIIGAKICAIAADPSKSQHRGVNLTGAIYYLKSHRPEEWSDRQTVVIESTGYAQDEAQELPARQAMMSVVNGGKEPDGGAPPDKAGTRE